MTGNGPLVDYLLACGWQRDDAPAEVVGECGMSSDTVGWCEKPSRWSKGGRGHLCAQHAAMVERYERARSKGRPYW